MKATEKQLFIKHKSRIWLIEFQTLSSCSPTEVSFALPTFSLDPFAGLNGTFCDCIRPGSRLYPGLHRSNPRRSLPCLHRVWDDGARPCTHLQRGFAPESGAFFYGKLHADGRFTVAWTIIQPASLNADPADLHLYLLSTHPDLPAKAWTSEEKHGSYTDISWKKAGY